MQSSLTSVKMKLHNPGTFSSSGNLWNVCAKKFSEKFPEHSINVAKASLTKANESRRLSKHFQSLELKNRTQLSALGALKYSGDSRKASNQGALKYPGDSRRASALGALRYSSDSRKASTLGALRYFGDSRKVSVGLSPMSRFYSPKCYKLMPSSSTNSFTAKRYSTKLHSNGISEKTCQQAILAYFRKNVDTTVKSQMLGRSSKGFATSGRVSSNAGLNRSEYSDYTNDLVAQKEQANAARKKSIWSSVMGARSETVKAATASLSPSQTALKGVPYSMAKSEETFNSNLMDFNRAIKNLISLGPRRNIYFIPRTANLSDPLCGWKHPTQFLPVDVKIKPKNIKFPKVAQALDGDTMLEKFAKNEKVPKQPVKQHKVLLKKPSSFLNKLLLGYDRSEASMKMNNYSYGRQKILYSAEEQKRKYGRTSVGDLAYKSEQNVYEADSSTNTPAVPQDSSCVKLRKNFMASGTRPTINTHDKEQLSRNQARQRSFLHSFAGRTGQQLNRLTKLSLRQQSPSPRQENESTVDAKYQEKFSKKMESIASLQDLIKKCPQSQAILYLANKY